MSGVDQEQRGKGMKMSLNTSNYIIHTLHTILQITEDQLHRHDPIPCLSLPPSSHPPLPPLVLSQLLEHSKFLRKRERERETRERARERENCLFPIPFSKLHNHFVASIFFRLLFQEFSSGCLNGRHSPSSLKPEASNLLCNS